MDTPEESTTDPQTQSDGSGTPNTYVDLLPETHGVVGKSAIPFHMTQSQKKRRKFIPFKYHSKIFKNSKKRMSKKGNDLSVFKGADPHKHGTRHAIEDNRISTSSSSYESCRPYKTNVSCHTYVDIEECLEHRDMEIERCNSISTVATLPIDLPVPRRHERIDMADNSSKRQLHDIQEQPQTDITPRIHYEMKVPDKSKAMKKYMVLFCIVLVSIVISTVMAGYFGTKNIVDDIPNKFDSPSQTLTLLEIIEALSNQTEIETLVLNQGFVNLTKKQQTLNKRFENLTSQIESDFSHFKNDTQTNIESVPKRFMNETDFLAWKEEVKKDLYTTLHLIVCVKTCPGGIDDDYQSCYTCDGYVSCSGGVLTNRSCQEGHLDIPLFWDNVKKRCDEHSQTCHPSYTFD